MVRITMFKIRIMMWVVGLFPWLTYAQVVEIGSGTVMHIGVGAQVSVGTASSTGTINTADAMCLVIESTSAGTGSLIGGGAPFATVNRYIEADMWHVVTPVTTGATVSNYHFNFSPRTWLTYFDESEADHGEFVYMLDLNDAIVPGQGYLYFIESSDQTLQYTGNLTSSDVELNSNSTPGLEFTDLTHGFNLLGNPFPCALDYDGTWAMTNVDDNVWIWDDDFGNYLSYSPLGDLGTLTDGIIPQGQGFFVHANASNPELTIPASARVHHAQSYYKESASATIPHVRIDVENNSRRDVVFFGMKDGATTGFDSGLDVRKMMGPDESPQACFMSQFVPLSIAVYPGLVGGALALPLSYIPGTDGIQLMKVSLIDLEGYHVEVEDKLLNLYYFIEQEDSLSFHAFKEDDPQRFVLHLNRNGTAIPEVPRHAAYKVYSHDNIITVKSPSEVNVLNDILIRDMTGRVVWQVMNNRQPMKQISLSNATGYYLVTVLTAGRVENTKVLIKH